MWGGIPAPIGLWAFFYGTCALLVLCIEIGKLLRRGAKAIVRIAKAIYRKAARLF